MTSSRHLQLAAVLALCACSPARVDATSAPVVEPLDVATIPRRGFVVDGARLVNDQPQWRAAVSTTGALEFSAQAFERAPARGALAQTQRLVEGSEISVTPGGEVQLLAADDTEVVLLLLERGRAAFDVEKRPTRRFVVKADGVEVRVVGTNFTVEREGRHVEVSVLRGIVEVREGGVPVVKRDARVMRCVEGVAIVR